MKLVQINPDTEIYMTHQEGVSGSDWREALLGGESAELYADTTVEAELPQFCDWIGGMIGNGYWLSAQDCIAALYPDADAEAVAWMLDNGRTIGAGQAEIISRTPREMLAALIRLAEEATHDTN